MTKEFGTGVPGSVWDIALAVWFMVIANSKVLAFGYYSVQRSG